MTKSAIDSLISDHEEGRPFTAHELNLTSQECEVWVRFVTNPQRFLPKIFDGHWAHIQQHPSVGPIRVLRVMTGTDGISRVIARQGINLYATPWMR
jgi:hypothetical protein